MLVDEATLLGNMKDEDEEKKKDLAKGIEELF